jgi:hypothetical protein
MKALLAIAALGLVAAAPADEGNPINKPGTNWSVYGGGKTKFTKDDGVPGGEVFRVTVPFAGKNAWDIGGSSPVQGAIAKGDAILVAFYARAPMLKDGETASLPSFGVSLQAPPYTPVVNGSAQITNKWTLISARGVAAQDVAAGTANVSVHLAAAKQVIDLGPVYVIDYGQNKDLSKL